MLRSCFYFSVDSPPVAFSFFNEFVLQEYIRPEDAEDARELFAFIKLVLRYEPHERTTAAQLLDHVFFSSLRMA